MNLIELCRNVDPHWRPTFKGMRAGDWLLSFTSQVTIDGAEFGCVVIFAAGRYRDVQEWRADVTLITRVHNGGDLGSMQTRGGAVRHTDHEALAVIAKDRQGVHDFIRTELPKFSR